MKGDQDFWNQRWIDENTGWDLGIASPPIQNFINGLKDFSLKILIPGAGNAYEVDYLLEKGFTHITVVDISPFLIEKLKAKYINENRVRLIEGDFFNLEGQFDLIIEQTFFCALNPVLRKDYVIKMEQLLSDNGYLVGLLFDREFISGPPYGGQKSEYIKLFSKYLSIIKMDKCETSYPARLGAELWFECKK